MSYPPAGPPDPPAVWWPAPTPGGPPPPASGGPGDGGIGAIVAAVAIGVWAVGATTAIQGVGWLVDQVVLVSGFPTPPWMWPVIALINALAVAVPAALLALVPKSASVRGAGRTWLIGGILVGALGLLRGIPIMHHEAYLASLAVLAAIGALILRRRPASAAGSDNPASAAGSDNPASRTEAPPAARPGATGFAVAAGLVVLVPWLWVGAAGGLSETILAAVAAGAVGWLAATVLDAGFWAPYAEDQPPRRSGPGQPPRRSGPGQRPARLVLVGGLVAGVALLLLGAGIGASGPHLATLLLLPPLGFAAAALRALTPRTGLAVACLVALAVFGPAAFVDPEEVTLLLLGRDVPFWAMIATAGSLVAGLLVGLAYGVTLPRGPKPAVAWVTAVVVALAAGWVYAGLGQPGLHGDRLFVVLRDQADLTAGLPAVQPGQAGRDARAKLVYERLVAHARRTQSGLHRDLDGLGLDYRPYYLVNAVEVTGGPEIRAWLSRRDDVDRVLLSQELRPVPSAPRPMRGTRPAPGAPQWNVTMLGADRAWDELRVTGAGITVGSSDSGVDGRHAALAAGYRGGDDSWYDPWNGTRTPTDRNGHGTHTLGSAVGRTNVGVAPGAQWVGCVNLDRNLGNPARYLDCMQFMLAPFPHGGDPFTDGRPERAPHVLTNSWGCPELEGCDNSALRRATAALTAAGIFFAAAAGNTGPFCGSIDDPPAPHPDAVTVGAVNRQREVTEFSSRGPAAGGAEKPDVVAPGAAVLSALPGGGYGELDGTSMATPHVAGVVALMWSADPTLIGDLKSTRRLLVDTAGDAELAPDADDCGDVEHLTGAGVVNAYAAVQAARAAR